MSRLGLVPKSRSNDWVEGVVLDLCRPLADQGQVVDPVNQLRSYYERDRKSKKWWHRLFYSLMETCLVNSWICFCDLVSFFGFFQTKEDERTKEKYLAKESIVDLL